jgi:hypothetical protein
MNTITQIEISIKVFKKKKYLVLFLIGCICLFLLIARVYYKHQINEGINIIKKSTNEKIDNKIVETFKVAQNTYTIEFTDWSKFVFLSWESKRGLFSELIIKGDRVFKDSNSNEIIVTRSKIRYTLYLYADTNNIEWKMKNQPNRDFIDKVDTLDE